MNKRTALLATLGTAIFLVVVGWVTIAMSNSNDTSKDTAMPGMTMSHTTSSAAGDEMGQMPGMKALVAGADGTRASAAGLTLEPGSVVFSKGRATPWELRVTDRQGIAVRKFERDQTKLMHLIVVRSDLTAYQHLHPVLGRGGVFKIGVRLPRPGTYRAIADFTTGGRRYALGVPIKVPGSANQAPLPGESMNANTDGFDVETKHAEPMVGNDTDLQFVIRRNGKAVKTLLPYLGAYGHLVALRKANIAYAHVHPSASDRAKGTITFVSNFPTIGAYRLFLQFRTAAGVHTAPFTINVKG